MNYEDLYQKLQQDEKDVKDQLALLQKLFKAVSRETENGDMKSLTRDLSAMAEKGQLTRHWPQETHLSLSITALP